MSKKLSSTKYASSFQEQFTMRGVIIGIIGTTILTMSSMFIALKLSSMPWSIMFVALVSMFSLKAFGNTNINEINVAHTIMSAGVFTALRYWFAKIPAVLWSKKMKSYGSFGGIWLSPMLMAVACGLAGDVMNDFKSGHLLHSDPKAQWFGEVLGA
ncbi:MAG: OPT/YSL family transporter [Lachnospiraceae bacterium]